mmetsp:Transcript_4784/g.11932  ORF Transcript_4784/g.11932 Transcript_4784/m.11932 type:complete len:235 (+) Transcript_4784:697-1401(+)
MPSRSSAPREKEAPAPPPDPPPVSPPPGLLSGDRCRQLYAPASVPNNKPTPVPGDTGTTECTGALRIVPPNLMRATHVSVRRRSYMCTSPLARPTLTRLGSTAGSEEDEEGAHTAATSARGGWFQPPQAQDQAGAGSRMETTAASLYKSTTTRRLPREATSARGDQPPAPCFSRTSRIDPVPAGSRTWDLEDGAERLILVSSARDASGDSETTAMVAFTSNDRPPRMRVVCLGT